MSPQEAIAAARTARQSWIELEPATDGQPAKRVQLLRPREAELQDFTPKPGQSDIERMVGCAVKYVTGWDGITMADLLGAAIAPADPAPFDARLWAEVLPDRMDWLNTVAAGLMDVIATHQRNRAAAAKN